jgi:hypothetical protein
MKASVFGSTIDLLRHKESKSRSWALPQVPEDGVRAAHGGKPGAGTEKRTRAESFNVLLPTPSKDRLAEILVMIHLWARAPLGGQPQPRSKAVQTGMLLMQDPKRCCSTSR